MKVLHKQANSHDCIICGIDNEGGLHASFYEMEDDSLIGLFTYKAHHQSYPERVHGGMICALCDEMIGRAIWIKHPLTYGCTMKLEMEYHAPVPYEKPLKARSYVEKETSLTWKGICEIRDEEGKLLARCHALYMFLTKKQISPNENVTDDDLNIMVPDDVKEIDWKVK